MGPLRFDFAFCTSSITRRALTLCVLFATVATACTYPATEVLVALDTDAPLSRPLTIRATLHRGSSTTTVGTEQSWVRGGPDGGIQLPGSFAVVPSASSGADLVTLVLDARLESIAPGQPELSFRRTARFAFTTHQTTSVPIFLSINCARLTTQCTAVTPDLCTVSELCEERGQTCGDNGDCVSVMVTPTPFDGGTTRPDTSVDATQIDQISPPMDSPRDSIMTTSTVTDLAAGGNNACVVTSAQTVVCWGGVFETATSHGPVTIAGIAGATEVAVGPQHICARIMDGTVRCVGANDHGQLGNGTTIDTTSVVSVANLSTVAHVAVGDTHSCALLMDGTVRCWGSNAHGGVGAGGASDVLTPTMVPGVSNVVQIVATTDSTFVRLMDGTTWAWGAFPSATGQQPTRTLFSSTADISSNVIIGCGTSNTGTAQCIGFFAPGDGGNYMTHATMSALATTGVRHVAAGRFNMCTLMNDSTVQCWGPVGDYLSQGNSQNLIPTTVPGLSNVVQLVAGMSFFCARKLDLSVVCWGANELGQLGQGLTSHALLPVRVAGVSGTQISTGVDTTCVVQTDGNVGCWGANVRSSLPITDDVALTPIVIPQLANVADIACGHWMCCARGTDRSVACWGANDFGQLGSAAGTDSPSPRTIPGYTSLVIAAGATTACGDNVDGLPQCWGMNLIDGTTGATPTDVQSGPLTTQIAIGDSHACVARSNNGVSCWGRNDEGELGSGSAGTVTNPAATLVLTTVDSISARGNRTCAVQAGTVYCWGARLDLTVTAFDATPTIATSSITNAKQVSVGRDHMCVATTAGTALCWGSNAAGQLGDGTATDRATPVVVTGLTNVQAVAASERHTCALLGDHSVYCWGNGDVGQLGDGRVGRSGTLVTPSLP